MNVGLGSPDPEEGSAIVVMGQLNKWRRARPFNPLRGIYRSGFNLAGSGDRQARRTFAPFFRTIIFILRTTEAAVGAQEIRGRKGEG